MSATYITVAVLPLLFVALWHLTATLAPPPPPQLRNKRIILLIAHPDDESMFFSPILQSLTHPSLQNHVKILCLSTGNADGLGDTRRRELEAAAVTLGLRKREDVFVLDDEKRFKDGMTENWDPKEIARVLASAFAPQLIASSPPPTTTPNENQNKKSNKSSSTTSKSKKSSSKSTSTTPSPAPTPPIPTGPRATIDVLITFDPTGISSHPNHISLYHGARAFLTNLMKDHAGYACPVSLYSLTSINIVRKYSFVLDAVTTLVGGVLSGGAGKQGGDKVMFVSGLGRYWKAREAMVSGHKSQMVWFRWGWIGVGRYMVVNDLKRERVAGAL